MRNLLFFSLVFFLLAKPALAAEEVLVIANKGHEGSLKREDIRDIFLGKKTTLNKDWHVEPLDQSHNKEIRSRFYRMVANKDVAEVQAQWAELVFSGRAKAPQSLSDDQAVMQYVGNNLDALGYVSAKATLDDKVAVVFRLRE